MKKFLITLFFLLILGGIVFFFGWAQFAVPPGSYGVARSKTHGVDTRLIQSGEFRWIWYKLIPTNVEIAVFRLDPVNHSFSARNTLPSGSTYAAFAGTNADFSWDLSGSVSFTLSPDALTALVADTHIGTQDELDAWEKDLAEKIGAFITGRFGSGEIEPRQLEDILKTGSSPELDREIQGKFPEAGNISCRITALKYPDFALYSQVRSLYEEFVALQREIMAAALSEKTGNQIDTRLRFDELEKYGALLARYPILLEYLALEKKVND